MYQIMDTGVYILASQKNSSPPPLKFFPVFVDFLRSFKLHKGILTCVLSLFSFFSSFPNGLPALRLSLSITWTKSVHAPTSLLSVLRDPLFRCCHPGHPFPCQFPPLSSPITSSLVFSRSFAIASFVSSLFTTSLRFCISLSHLPSCRSYSLILRSFFRLVANCNECCSNCIKWLLIETSNC